MQLPHFYPNTHDCTNSDVDPASGILVHFARIVPPIRPLALKISFCRPKRQGSAAALCVAYSTVVLIPRQGVWSGVPRLEGMEDSVSTRDDESRRGEPHVVDDLQAIRVPAQHAQLHRLEVALVPHGARVEADATRGRAELREAERRLLAPAPHDRDKVGSARARRDELRVVGKDARFKRALHRRA
eukprot:199705-Pleurochrysis_carterae.AAC.4